MPLIFSRLVEAILNTKLCSVCNSVFERGIYYRYMKSEIHLLGFIEHHFKHFLTQKMNEISETTKMKMCVVMKKKIKKETSSKTTKIPKKN